RLPVAGARPWARATRRATRKLRRSQLHQLAHSGRGIARRPLSHSRNIAALGARTRLWHGTGMAPRPDIIAPADAAVWRPPNHWDGIAALIVLGLIATVGLEFQQLARPLPPHEAAIDLDPAALPGYALRTVARMLAAMALSLAFSFAYAPLAARNE